MADDLFDKKKIIAALRAQGVPDKDIEKLYGSIPKPVVNSAKADAHRAANSWKYDNKHKRPVRAEDDDPDYEPIEELRKKTTGKKPKPRISKKKPKPKPKPVKNDWNSASEARLKALYEAGYSNQEMAEEFKTTVDAITGKLGRMRKAGWKGMVGTTHAPLPKPAVSSAEASKLSPGMKKMLASALEVNFGAVGRFFSKKWGLIDDRKFGGHGGGGKADVTAAVIKSNETVMAALTKLDTSLKRSSNLLTKSISLSTSKITDAITNTIDLIKKNGAGGGPTGTPGGGSVGGGGGSVAGILAALTGGGILSSLMGSRGDASTNPSDMIDKDADTAAPSDTESNLRELGDANKKDLDPTDIEIKVKELLFSADDITFEADEFKFDAKSGGGKGVGGGSGKKGGAAGDGGGAAGGAGAGGDDATGASKPSAGMFNSLADKLGLGGGGSGILNGIMNKLGVGGGGSGGLNSLADALTGSGGGGGGGVGGVGGGGGGSPIPSDSDMASKDKSWWDRMSGGKGKGGANSSNGGGAPNGPTPGDGNSFLKAQRAGFAKELQDNPDTHKLLAGIISAENPGAGPAVAESLMNRTAFMNEKRAKQGLEPLTLKDMIRGHPSIGGGKSFYGPMRTGAINSHLKKLDDPKYAAKMYDHINKALGGSNATQGHTDQGSAGDPNYLAGGTGVNINGERFNDWGVPGSAQFRERQQAQAAAAEKADAQKQAGPGGEKIDPAMVQKGGPVSDGKYNELDAQAATKTEITAEKPKDISDPNKELMEKMQKEYNSSGSQLLEKQKESDTDKANTDSDNDSGGGSSGGGKRSDIGGDNETQTAMLETTGPSHFSDYGGLGGSSSDSWQSSDA